MKITSPLIKIVAIFSLAILLGACRSQSESAATANQTSAPQAVSAQAPQPQEPQPQAPSEAQRAQVAAMVARGEGYELVKKPQSVPDNGDIYVEEFFWYGCPHCYYLEPQLQAWQKRQPKDVQLVRVPAVLNMHWGRYAHVYYVIKGFDLLPQAHEAMFAQIHKAHVDMQQSDNLMAFFKGYGIDEERIKKAFDPENPSIHQALLQAVERVSAFEISSVPTLVVNGRYKVSGKTVKNVDDVMLVVDELIKKERLTR